MPSAVDIIVPVHGAAAALARCARSLLRHTDLDRHRLRWILDGPQDRASQEVVDGVSLELGERCEALRLEVRRGFPAAANLGLAGSERDAVLLNSDTRVTRGWVEKLQAAATSAPRVASATPFSNAATIASLPRWLETNALPAGWDEERFAELVEQVSTRSYPRLPTGVGVCLYLRRAALDDVGNFDEKSFGMGYGEEVDWCRRALRRGWEHVLDDATFIYHEGQASFGPGRAGRVRRAEALIGRRHPGWRSELSRFLAADPLRPLRQRVIERLTPTRSARNGARQTTASPRRVVHLVHGWPPWNHAGSELYAAWLVRWQAERRDVAVYSRYADATRRSGDALELLDAGVRVRLTVNNFTQRDPFSRNGIYDRRLGRDFARFLEEERPEIVHIHHLAGHAANLAAVAARRAPVVMQLQDWWTGCARANLLDFQRRLCSGPGPRKCPRCRPLTRLFPRPLLGAVIHNARQRRMRGVLVHASALVAGSHALAESFARLGWLPPSRRIRVLAYATPFDDLLALRRRLPTTRPIRCGFVGSFLPHKGAHVAVRAFAGIPDDQATLSLWGDATASQAYTEELGRVAAQTGSAPRLRGTFHEKDRHEVFANLDLLLVPSLGLESFGFAATEAAAAGVPVLASDRGALAELGAQGTARLLDPERPADWTAAILELAAHPERLDEWRNRLPLPNSFAAHAEAMEDLYREVVAGRNPESS